MKRSALAVAAFLASFQAVAFGQSRPLQQALQSGLTWYYRWIKEIPANVRTVQCSLAEFENKSFAYCSQGPLEIDIEPGTPPRVTSIVTSIVTFDRALADFLGHRGPVGVKRGPVREISISVVNLNRCDVDWHRTRWLRDAALNREDVEAFHRRGLTLRYPVFCKGDPFYLVYLMEGDRIRSIWEFEVAPGKADLRWSYDSDSKQREIPRRAAKNLEKDMWYELLK